MRRALFGMLFVSGGAIVALAGCSSTNVTTSRMVPTTAPTNPPAATNVSSLRDAGAGSLRSAIAAANAAGGPTTITFSVHGTIKLTGNLPVIHADVKIDGTTAPQYNSLAPVVEVNANGRVGFVFGKGSSGSQLLAIAVDNAGGNGVLLEAGHITLNLNYIGLNLQGAAFGNQGDGVFVSPKSTGNLIGLNASGASGVIGNVISANKGTGITLSGSSGNIVVANRIGTNPTGTAAIANGGNGIWITSQSNGNEIGGTEFVDTATGNTNDPTGDKGTVPPVFVVPPLGNLVSGNGGNGVQIDEGSQKNELNGNFIGTTAIGDGPIGNAGNGVWIDQANNNSLVGCKFVNNPFVYYNVLAGNGGNGLRVSSSDGVIVQGNFFGTGANNTTLVPNAEDGILVDGTSQGTTVGGVIPLGNVSAGNTRNGIEVTGTVSGFITFNTFGGLLAFKGAAPNGNDGLLITATGGNQTVRTNVFSGNAHNGIEIAGDASGVTVDPDIVGLNTNGSGVLPNGTDGLLIDGTAHDNKIGGFTQSVIPQDTFSGNKAYGIAIIGGAHDNDVFNSSVGVNVTGLAALGNGLGGIYVGGSAERNLIGGVTTNSSQPKKNLISGNTGNGVTLDTGSSYSAVLNNWIGLSRNGHQRIPNTGLPIVVKPGSTHNTIRGNVIKPT
jgi:parallel beta-helix repeat protein